MRHLVSGKVFKKETQAGFAFTVYSAQRDFLQFNSMATPTGTPKNYILICQFPGLYFFSHKIQFNVAPGWKYHVTGKNRESVVNTEKNYWSSRDIKTNL